MAKFCTKCGSPLEDGKPCKCEKKEVKTVSTSSIGDLFKEYFEVLKKMVKKPIDTLKDYNDEGNFNLGLISSGISSVILGLVMCLIVKSMIGSLSGLVEIPYVKVFFLGFIIMAAMIIIMSCVSYLIIEKLLKGKTSFKKMVVLFGLSSIVFAESLVLAVVLAILNVNLMVVYIIISIGALIWFAYNIKGLELFAKIDENLIGYVMAGTDTITIIIIYFLIETVIGNILM